MEIKSFAFQDLITIITIIIIIIIIIIINNAPGAKKERKKIPKIVLYSVRFGSRILGV